MLYHVFENKMDNLQMKIITIAYDKYLATHMAWKNLNVTVYSLEFLRSWTEWN